MSKKILSVTIEEELYNKLKKIVENTPGGKLSPLVNHLLEKTIEIYINYKKEGGQGKK